MEDTAILGENLARLRARNPALAELVEGARNDRLRVEWHAGEVPEVSCDGVLLASRYDPAAEGRRLADGMHSQGIDLTVAIGFSLGHHLETWHDRHAGPLLIFEPSPERLRTALALRPLPWLASERVDFASDAMELGDLVARHYTPGLRIGTFLHPSCARLSPEAAREAVHRVGRVKDNADISAITRVHCVEGWTRLTIENAPHLLRTPSFSRLQGAFRGVPAVVAAAGPSLDRQLPLLAREAERLLVLAIGPSLGALRAHGIQPDLVHILESTDVAHQLTAHGDTSDLSLVLTPKVHPGLFELPARARFVAYTASERFGCWMAEALGDSHVIPGEPSVALSAVRVAAALGADPILLIGQDLAFTDGRVYAKGSCYDRVGFERTRDGQLRYTSPEQKLDVYGGDRRSMERAAHQPLVWVEGTNGEQIPSCPGYAQFIDCYREIGAQLKSWGVRLVNCTEGGARLSGVEHAPFREVIESCPAGPLPARERIVEAFDTAPALDPARFREPLASARRALRRLERRVASGLRQVEEVARCLKGRLGATEVARQLRRAQRAERRVQRALAATPWLEALIQAEVHQAVALQRQADRATPGPGQAIGECLVLLRAADRGIAKTRTLFDRFEALTLQESARAGSA